MLELGLWRPVKKREDADFSSSEDEVATLEGHRKRHCLMVEQLRMEDLKGNLKMAYPVRTDLRFAAAVADSGTRAGQGLIHSLPDPSPPILPPVTLLS